MTSWFSRTKSRLRTSATAPRWRRPRPARARPRPPARAPRSRAPARTRCDTRVPRRHVDLRTRVVDERRHLLADPFAQPEQQAHKRDRKRHTRHRQPQLQRLMQKLPPSQRKEPTARPASNRMRASRHCPTLLRPCGTRIRSRFPTRQGGLRSFTPAVRGQYPMCPCDPRSTVGPARRKEPR
jgi:hypothetical protein